MNIHDNDEADNRINVYKVLHWDVCEIVCPNAAWTGGIRTASGVARRFDQEGIGDNNAKVEARVLVVPTIEAGGEQLWSTARVDEDWTKPCTAWLNQLRISWPDQPPTGSSGSFGLRCKDRLRISGLDPWSHFAHLHKTRTVGPRAALMRRGFLVPSLAQPNGVYPLWMGAPVLHSSLLQQALSFFPPYEGCTNQLPLEGEQDIFGNHISEQDDRAYGVARTVMTLPQPAAPSVLPPIPAPAISVPGPGPAQGSAAHGNRVSAGGMWGRARDERPTTYAELRRPGEVTDTGTNAPSSSQGSDTGTNAPSSSQGAVKPTALQDGSFDVPTGAPNQGSVKSTKHHDRSFDPPEEGSVLLGAPAPPPAPGGSAGGASRDRTSPGGSTGGHRPADLKVLIDFKLEAVSSFTRELLDRKAFPAGPPTRLPSPGAFLPDGGSSPPRPDPGVLDRPQPGFGQPYRNSRLVGPQRAPPPATNEQLQVGTGANYRIHRPHPRRNSRGRRSR